MPPQRRRGRFQAARPSHSKRPKSYRVTCSGCGKEVVTQVSPPEGQKLLCIDCFTQPGTPKEKL
jgi:formylmethanofuran dehydrogenase subunit E